MQGRLVPPMASALQCFPRGRWSEEFARARAADIDGIEWIFDTFGGGDNPLGSREGLERLRALARAHRVEVRSLCADYFMEHSFTGVESPERDKRLERLHWLLERCAAAGIGRVVLPFVDRSAIRDDADLKCVRELVSAAAPQAEANAVELHLETSLPPKEFAELLAGLDERWVKVNYDIGNSAALGHDPRAEFAAYGARVGSVHVKDRVRGGTTVPLGTGAADFGVVFRELQRVGYDGDYILQVARGDPGGEVQWARRNRGFVVEHLQR